MSGLVEFHLKIKLVKVNYKATSIQLNKLTVDCKLSGRYLWLVLEVIHP